MRLAILIPAYNEEKTIKEVLKSLPRKIKGIDEIISIVTDDGSTDGTFDLAKENSTYVLQHMINLGVGAALTSGFEAAKKLKCDLVVTMDADGQHSSKDIKKIIEPILEKKADVVIGTRMLKVKGMPKFKVFGNWTMNLLTFIFFRQWTTDSQSGMRALNKKALAKMLHHSMGYEICSEMIGEIRRNQLKMIEVPIEVIYTSYSKLKGQSWLNGINILTRLLTIKIAIKK